MTCKKVVIALGGNALQEKGTPPTAEAQLDVVRRTCEHLADLIDNYEMAIVHGNGPQVGRIALTHELAFQADPNLPAMPFDVCGSMSQGYIGYQIQQCLRDAIRNRNRDIPVVTILTQVVVDKNDPAFQNPTKPIGAFFTEEEAKKLTREKGYVMKEDAGRGWRRYVASPNPLRITEIDSIKRLWDTTIVVTGGGGGIPVAENMDGSLTGVPAVIDKDMTAELLAEDIRTDYLLILTNVERISINYNKPNQKELSHLTMRDAVRYVEEGHFAPGSMLPKVMAAIKFVRRFPDKRAIITSLDKALDALRGNSGTFFSMS
ncbi:MAG: carbamate kinase [Synergistaceae bacterium]|jgi:carbamate kinase|nr:carbamate kinase [Synergistaceae bacterium]